MSLTLVNGYGFNLTLSPNLPTCRILDAEGGRVVCEPRRTKVAIVAFGPTGEACRAYHDDPEWEIWGLNDGYRSLPLRDYHGRLVTSRWFELHIMSVQPSDDLSWLSVCPVPVYMPATDARVPNGVRFPVERIEAAFPMLGRPFWACTFAYQIALAISEGFTTIALCGFDFGSAREWIFERPNVLWWAGYAAGLGVQVLIPEASTFLRHPYRYGIEYHEEADWCNLQVGRMLEAWKA